MRRIVAGLQSRPPIGGGQAVGVECITHGLVQVSGAGERRRCCWVRVARRFRGIVIGRRGKHRQDEDEARKGGPQIVFNARHGF